MHRECAAIATEGLETVGRWEPPKVIHDLGRAQQRPQGSSFD